MLKAKQIENAKPAEKPYRLRDGRGLYLEVRPTAAKFWRYRYKLYKPGGTADESMFAVGEWVKQSTGIDGQFTLEEARIERDKCRALVKQGIHPIHRKRADKVRRAADATHTFEGVAREWIAKNRSRWSAGYAKQTEDVLVDDVFRYIGGLPIREVTAAHLLEIVERVEKRDAKTLAILIRQYCGAIFRLAIRTLRADSDPSAALKGAVSRDKVRHHPHLEERDIPAYYAALEAYQGEEWVKIMLRLLPLVFTRPSELRMAKWSEFDLDGATWVIPPERMKMREKHLVPLSTQAIALLRRLHEITGNREHLFPNRRDPKRCANKGTVNAALVRMGYKSKLTGHGFRGTASTILNGMHFKPDVIERQLAHKPRDKSRASYDHAKYLPERRAMLQQWANYLDGLCTGADVVPIHRAAAPQAA